MSLAGRLTLVPEREFALAVPGRLEDPDRTYRELLNPINQLGPLFAVEVPLATANDRESFLAAFNKRCNFEAKDDIDDVVFAEAMALIHSLPDKFTTWDENEDDRSRWMSKFGAEKQARMEDAFNGLDEMDARRLGVKDLSVKMEILLKRSDPTWAPRIIYAGSDTFNAVTGPPAMVAMERLMELLTDREFGGVNVRFGYKTTDTVLAAHLVDPEFPHTVEGDYSRNDREQRKRVHIIFDAWLEKLGMPIWYRKLEKELAIFKVQNSHHGLTATLKWQLPTGTTTTTVRNSAYNLTMFAVSMRRQNIRAKALVLGDDLLAVTNLIVDLVTWVATVALFRMVLKAKSPQLHAFSTFLSKRLVVDVDTPCMFPLIGKALLRFNARGTNNMAVTDTQYMAGKALSYAYEFRHVPFMRNYFLRRYKMEDCDAVTTEDLTWFSKSLNLSLDQIILAIYNEKVVLSDDEFEYACLMVYDLGITQLEQMCEDVIVSKTPLIYEHPEAFKLLVDTA